MSEQTVTEIKPVSEPMPMFTSDDFSTEEPYKWLYRQHFSRFELRRALNKLIEYGVSLGVKKLTIQQYWNDYLADQKPAMVVGSNSFTAFPEQEKVLGADKTLRCGKYLCDQNGVSYVGQMGEWVQVIAHPVMPVKRIVDVETNMENLKIAYCRVIQNGDAFRAMWKELITPRVTLASAQRIITLSEHGIAVNSENAKEVVKYISDIETLNYSEMDTQLSCSHMGWLPDGQFAPYAKDVVYGGDSDEFEKIYKGFKECGSEETWMNIAKRVRSGKSIPARIALATSFAAPLVHKLGALSFFVHLWGDKGTGKSVALMLGASVWGNPVIGNYIKSFSATKVSQELFASFCCNLPVFMDELQVISDRRLFDDIIYALCEGVSKGRGTKDGGLQLSRRWETVFVTTGEMPIVQSNSGGGAAVRTIEVGFGGESFFDDAREVANTLKQNYGFAGKKFIQALNETDMEELNKAQRAFFDKLSGEVQDKQVLSASLILTADKLADDVLFHDGNSLTAAEISRYLVSKSESDNNERCFQYVCDWVKQNKEQFDENSEYRHGLWGVLDEKKNEVYIFKSALEEYISKYNFPLKPLLDWADRKGILIKGAPGPDRKNRYTKVRKLKDGKTFRSIAFKLPNEEECEEVDDEPLPF